MTTQVKFQAPHLVQGMKVEIVATRESAGEETVVATLGQAGDEYVGVVYDGQRLTAREVPA